MCDALRSASSWRLSRVALRPAGVSSSGDIDTRGQCASVPATRPIRGQHQSRGQQVAGCGRRWTQPLAGLLLTFKLHDHVTHAPSTHPTSPDNNNTKPRVSGDFKFNHNDFPTPVNHVSTV